MRRIRTARGTWRERGQIVILTGLTLIVLIGMVGLAIDSGRGYGVRAKLNAAVDAASIAAARALSEGADDATRITNAQAAAARFFNGNYPADYLGSVRGTPSVQATRDPATRRWTVTVSGTADMPTTFMRVLGMNQMAVGASGTTIRRDLDVMMVLDVSGSLDSPPSPAGTFSTLKSAAITGFLNKFTPGSGGDRVGLVSFSSGAVLDVAINKDSTRGHNRTTLTNAINNLVVGGATASAEAMRKALEELNAIPAAVRSDLRVILFFSDGAPNLINGTFPLQGGGNVTGNLYSETAPDAFVDGSGRTICALTDGACREFPANERNGTQAWYSSGNSSLVTGPRITSLPNTGSGTIPLASYNARRALAGVPYSNTRCNVNIAARNMVENVANNARASDPPVFVYSVGLGAALDTLEVTFCGYVTATEKGATILNRLANTTASDTYNSAQPKGLYCYAATASELERCFSTIASEVLRLAM